MEYKENMLCYEDYYRLRESVNWLNFSEQQTQKALNSSLYTVIAVENNQTIGMGRLIGDGLYYMIVDIIVHPAYQKNGVGSQIINMIIKYVDDETPINGRSSIQLIAEKGKETFYQKMGFKLIPHDFCGSGMRKVIHK
ncbi:GNAT family N-acetyltransferase [Lachnotalea sp. AF33-28]|jgi:GNAT superfamily N-acetyltransferase|uniref:GNAT family N-acetyltransferase n=1 Tax=Lachnotalea sp. AF33-28 TaxID=2292046 RepID=UPI000E47E404|nr:GNAT family N-acetyltransferase [Lachnotalea sp. AF33-28]RHP34831.1 GNAT family N-acetyltransferase [Lachnotalea sp. AF33-28]